MRRREILTIFCVLASVASCEVADTPPVATVSSALEGAAAEITLSNFAVWSTDAVVLRDRTKTNGLVGSNTRVELGADAVIAGNVISGKDGCALRNRAQLQGNLITSGRLTKEPDASVTGTVSELVTVPVLTIPTKSVVPGTESQIVSGQRLTLAPGAYKEVILNAGGSLVLSAGAYQLGRLIVGASSASIEIQAGSGPVAVNVANQLLFADGARIHLVGANDPNLVQFYSAQSGTLRIGVESMIQGTITAPNATIEVSSRSSVFGHLYAKRVTIDTDAQLNWSSQPPVLPVLTGTTVTPSFVPRASAPVVRSRPVVVDVAAIQSSRNQQLQLEIFADLSLKTVGTRIERNGPGYVWLGRIAGQPQSLVALSVRSGVLAGDVHTESGDYYQIRYAGNVHVAQQLDAKAFPDEGDSPLAGAPGPAPDPCGGTESGAILDTLVTYTPAMANEVGGGAAAEALIAQAVAVANETYGNSNIQQQLRLVYVGQTNYTEEVTPRLDVNHLVDPLDGRADDVPELRDLYDADLVAMLVKKNNQSSFGEAYAVMENVSTDFASSAYAAIDHTMAVDHFTLAHEFGHLMAARHDWASDSKNNLPYAFNHGFVDPLKKWGTVMAANASCPPPGCNRVPYWSNPDVTYLGTPTGVALGSANPSDNHQTLNDTAQTVANFRCSSGVNNVWMRDTLQDTGLEPDPKTAAQNMWESPYIWVRNTQDTGRTHQHEHENPVYGTTNWVYVKLHNGATTVQSGTLEIYYANASASLNWPDAWNLLGTVNLASFNPKSTQIAELTWTNLPGEGHYCLLARWNSPQDPMHTPESTDINANVRNNNNLVWRNLNILAPGSDGKMSAAFNMAGAGYDYALSVGPTADEANGSFLLYGSAQIELGDTILQQWIANGRQGRGFQLQPGSSQIDIVDPSGALLEGIRLPGQVETPTNYPVVLRVTRPPTTPLRTFHLQVEQFYKPAADLTFGAGSNGYVSLGAVTYELRPETVGTRTVTIGEDGKLAGAMTGYAWVAGGTGTTFVSPNPCNETGCFKNTGGRLCTQGTIAPVSCGDGCCDWTENWGAEIGLNTALAGSWGSAAARAVSILYSGDSGPYRLIARVLGASASEHDVYCVDNYISGEFVQPSMLRLNCWSDTSQALTSFEAVDSFGLQRMSALEAVSFDYCISGITLR